MTTINNYNVGIFPTISRSSTRFAPRGEGIVITLQGPRIYLADSGPQPTSVQELRTRGVIVSSYIAGGVNLGAILVPDGVASVTVDEFRLTTSTSPRLTGIRAATSSVRNNVALFQLAGLTEHNLHLSASDLAHHSASYQSSGRRCHTSLAIYGLPATAQMTWLNAAGKAIHRTTVSFRLYVGTHPPAARTVGNPDCSQRPH